MGQTWRLAADEVARIKWQAETAAAEAAAQQKATLAAQQLMDKGVRADTEMGICNLQWEAVVVEREK